MFTFIHSQCRPPCIPNADPPAFNPNECGPPSHSTQTNPNCSYITLDHTTTKDERRVVDDGPPKPAGKPKTDRKKGHPCDDDDDDTLFLNGPIQPACDLREIPTSM